jgi:hypothetical protein
MVERTQLSRDWNRLEGWKHQKEATKGEGEKGRSRQSSGMPKGYELSPQLSVFHLGFLQDGNVGIGTFSGWRLVGLKRQADAAQQVLKARVLAKGIEFGVDGDPGRAVRALIEGFSQP